jgi:catechol-2,3-dioxygenase
MRNDLVDQIVVTMDDLERLAEFYCEVPELASESDQDDLSLEAEAELIFW